LLFDQLVGASADQEAQQTRRSKTLRIASSIRKPQLQENALPLRRPSFLNTMAAGQNPVNEAWIMFSPANAVSRYQ
jgi:hypothetical protein